MRSNAPATTAIHLKSVTSTAFATFGRRDVSISSPAFNPLAIQPGGHVPSKSCPPGAGSSVDAEREAFLRLARAM